MSKKDYQDSSEIEREAQELFSDLIMKVNIKPPSIIKKMWPSKKIALQEMDRERIMQVGKKGIELELANCSIGDKEATALARVLKNNTNVTKIDLSSNQIGDKGVRVLVENLELNTGLTKIDLSYNKIGDSGAQALAKSLRSNISLNEVNLSYNKIGNIGIKKIAIALKINTSVVEILLGDNKDVDNEGAIALADTLKKNNTIP